MGRVAIGGSYNGSTTFDSTVSDSTGTWSVVVGGNLSLSGTQIAGGDVFVGGNANFNGTTIPNKLAVDGSLTASGGARPGGAITYGTTVNVPSYWAPYSKQTVTDPIDFTAAATNLKSVADSLLGLTANGTTSISFNNITLTTTTSGINVFKLTAAQVASATGFTINNSFGSNATVIIDVLPDAGGSDTMPNVGYNLNGINDQHVIWNFGSGTTSINSSLAEGTLLAPYASVTLGAAINGQVIVGALAGTGEIHNDLFAGSLPNVTVGTPEPASGMMLLGGVAVFGLVRVRRKTKEFKW